MADVSWCQKTAQELADGRVTEKDMISSPPSGKWANELARWENECGDRGLRKLRKLQRQGQLKCKKRQQDADSRMNAILKSLDSKKLLTAKEQADHKAINESSDKAWNAIKAACQTAVKVVDQASKESNANPHIKVWNSRLASNLHNFLSTSNKWMERGKKAISVYNAFVVLSRVRPSLAATNPREYAQQMGNATAALGNALKLLPAPFGAYGEFLEKTGKFFVSMSDKLIPGQRPSANDYKPGGKFYNPYDRVFTFLKSQ